MIVTTGGQQVIDLVCKTLIDPGDVIVAEAPTYPGAVPTFSAYQAAVEQIEIDADGMPIDAKARSWCANNINRLNRSHRPLLTGVAVRRTTSFRSPKISFDYTT